MWRPTSDELEQTFDYYLRRAVFFDEYLYGSCTGLVSGVWKAILRIEHDRTPEAVLSARDQLQRQIDNTDWKEWMAAREAFDSGLIPERQPDHPEETKMANRHEYFGEILQTGYADPEAARIWIENNREDPGEIYSRWVLDQCGLSANDAESHCAVVILHRDH